MIESYVMLFDSYMLEYICKVRKKGILFVYNENDI